jgi:hypothetical protein
VFNATSASSNGYPQASAVAKATVTITNGEVVALISGGNKRRWPVYLPLVLDASSSYDQNSPTATLSYSWSCRIQSFDNFDENCDSFIDVSTISTSAVKIDTSSMKSSIVYAISVDVFARDNRYGIATVSVQAIAANASTSINSVLSATNIDSLLSIGSIIVGQSPTYASWTVLYLDEVIPLLPTTPTYQIFSRAEVLSPGIQFPVSFPPNTFQAGVTYKFRLVAYPIADSSLFSSSEISITMNSPPSGGIVVVSPSNGVEIITSFLISAQGWVSENFPLEYFFIYQVSIQSPRLTIRARSRVSYVSTSLPAGLAINSNAVILRATIFDSFSASSIGETFATVNQSAVAILPSNTSTPVQAATDQLAAILTNVLDDALTSGDVDRAVQVVNVVGSSIPRVSCSRTNDTFCASLNRESCQAVPNTCGDCQPGYIGVVGPYNSKCQPSSTMSVSDCISDSDCVFGSCIAGSCVTPEKSCPSNTDSICSGNGECRYFDSSGNNPHNCSVINSYCYAKCVCNADFGGIDCSLSPDESLARTALRQQLCLSIMNITQALDPSIESLNILISSFLNSYSSSEIASLDAQHICLSTFAIISDLAKNGFFSSSESVTIYDAVNILSSFLQSGVFTSTNSSSKLSSILSDNIALGVLATMIDGQPVVEITHDFVQMTLYSLRALSSNSTVLSPVQSNAYGSLSQSISLSSYGLSSCFNYGGYSRFAVMQYLSKPVLGTSSTTSPLLKFSYQYQDATPDLNSSFSPQAVSFHETSQPSLSSFSSRTYELDREVAFSVTFQFSEKQNFNFSLDLLNGDAFIFPDNSTLPQCTVYDFESYDYAVCRSCNISSYTNYNVTFACVDISMLCFTLNDLATPSQNQSQNSGDRVTSSSSNSILTNLFGSLLRGFSRTISGNPFTIDIGAAITAITLTACLLVVFVVGIFLFIRWDSKDYDLKVQKEDKTANSGRQNSVRFNIITSTHASDNVETSKRRFHKWEKQLNVNPADSARFLDSDKVDSELFVKTNSLTDYLRLFLRSMSQHHVYFSPFFR